ncbi:sugar ABC transporter permease [Aquibacillus koreensis]|uniref:Sugar ABC transporter permease n=1 Tax=Aquibacillus koreensis TaxID=279446 RepID=A0A9X3WQ16_9BACI|nr:sugar ABC transporter permease [Aquibacillus koreensis]MCT2536675.1 sugar ABC transporter permease [Aquibacillus koreensis]MDC3422628.1 sugar ABC transporter permease [Aquibacillus koreensis]
MALQRKWILILFAAPTVLFYLFFFISPLLNTVYNSLFDWNGLSDKTFIFIDNYINLFQDEIFIRSLKNTFYWVFLVLFVQIPFGFFLAYFLYLKVKGFKFLRTVFFIPVVTSTVAVALVFSFIYEPNFGIINAFLREIGLGHLTTAWLSDELTAMTAVSVPFVWQNIGLMMVIIYAGLQSIPDEIIEAGEIDGVGFFQKIIHIVIPMIKNVLIVCLVLGVTYAFKLFDYVLLLTNGGPIHRTEVTGTYMYIKGFQELNYGYGNSIAVTMTIIVLFLSVIINKGLKSKG